MADRRTFLRGLISLPLIGGGVTLIGAPSAPVPLIQAAAMPTLGDPRQRARYAWEAFSAAMGDLTTHAHGWRVLGAGDVRPEGRYPGSTFLRVVEVHLEHLDPSGMDLIVDRHREIDLA